jgi:hypothetical protein
VGLESSRERKDLAKASSVAIVGKPKVVVVIKLVVAAAGADVRE